MSEEERMRAAQREYHRKWRAEHPDAVRAAQVRYWTKKADEMGISARSMDNDNNTNSEE